MSMPLAVHIALLLFASLPTLACLYLALLTLLSARIAVSAPRDRRLRFDVLVPAHDEAAVIARTIASLRALDWPADRYRVIVVVDNCSDDTAAIARDAGVRVLERRDTERRGKGYALEYGIDASLGDQACDGVVVIDADSEVSANLLSAFALRLEHGAEAIQARHGVLNPGMSWRTRLAAVAYAASHAVRGRGRERLGVSCGLRGNGMCFSVAMLRRHPFRVYSMAEDLEYGVVLGLAGVRVHYADEADVDAEMVASGSGAASQRRRWERGRLAVVRQYTVTLLAAAWRRRDRTCLELALDLLTPPLGYLVVLVAMLAGLGLALSAWDRTMLFWTAWAGVLLLLLGGHVLRGWRLSGQGWRALLDMVRVPFFVAWKLWATLRGGGDRSWVRTRRNDERR